MNFEALTQYELTRGVGKLEGGGGVAALCYHFCCHRPNPPSPTHHPQSSCLKYSGGGGVITIIELRSSSAPIVPTTPFLRRSELPIPWAKLRKIIQSNFGPISQLALLRNWWGPRGSQLSMFRMWGFFVTYGVSQLAHLDEEVRILHNSGGGGGAQKLPYRCLD